MSGCLILHISICVFFILVNKFQIIWKCEFELLARCIFDAKSDLPKLFSIKKAIITYIVTPYEHNI